MKEITLSTGRIVSIAPLKLKQLRRMTELVDQEKAMEATIAACMDSIANAGGSQTQDEFESDFSIPEVNELFRHVCEISEISVGEAKASQ